MIRLELRTHRILLMACGIILVIICILDLWQPWTGTHDQSNSQNAIGTSADFASIDKRQISLSSKDDLRHTTQSDTVFTSTLDPSFMEFAERALQEEMSRTRSEISGTIFKAKPQFWWDDFFAELEKVQSIEELEQVFMKMGKVSKQPAAGTIVTVRNDSFSKQATTDSEGNFKFGWLPPGAYTISYSYPSRSMSGDTQEIVDERIVQFDHNFCARLKLGSDGITVRGRITDAHGRPISGAKIIGTKPSWNSEYDPSPSAPIVATSKADGSYELKGITPTKRSFLDVFAYLINGAAPNSGFLLDVQVEAIGLDKNNSLKVPLVTEGLLHQGRRFLEVYSKVCQRVGWEERKEKENLPYPLPVSHGNVITAPEIVID